MGKLDAPPLGGELKSNSFLIALSGLEASKSINIIHKNTRAASFVVYFLFLNEWKILARSRQQQAQSPK